MVIVFKLLDVPWNKPRLARSAFQRTAASIKGTTPILFKRYNKSMRTYREFFKPSMVADRINQPNLYSRIVSTSTKSTGDKPCYRYIPQKKQILVLHQQDALHLQGINVSLRYAHFKARRRLLAQPITERLLQWIAWDGSLELPRAYCLRIYAAFSQFIDSFFNFAQLRTNIRNIERARVIHMCNIEVF